MTPSSSVNRNRVQQAIAITRCLEVVVFLVSVSLQIVLSGLPPVAASVRMKCLAAGSKKRRVSGFALLVHSELRAHSDFRLIMILIWFRKILRPMFR